MADFRTETDSLGEVAVPADKLWGAQTQRSLTNFRISGERMPPTLIKALAQVKRASAIPRGSALLAKALCIDGW